jgi:hypothetical protein
MLQHIGTASLAGQRKKTHSRIAESGFRAPLAFDAFGRRQLAVDEAPAQ